ncbi:hypothetical protein ACWNXI_04805 [Caldibacillus thermoamylovorans]
MSEQLLKQILGQLHQLNEKVDRELHQLNEKMDRELRQLNEKVGRELHQLHERLERVENNMATKEDVADLSLIKRAVLDTSDSIKRLEGW